MKIAIIGYSGCGKSTLAARLGKKYNIPVLHLDKVHWLPGWKERETEDEKQIVREFLKSNESWVIDGNYSKLEYQNRLKVADKIIIMRFNRFSCLYRAIKRHKVYKGKTRESMTQGCDEKMDFEFVWWILHKGRRKKLVQQYKEIEKNYADKTIVIKNQRNLDKLLFN